ncbi:MAG: hypothetical protein H7Y60_10330 [Rhodospirillaceae bacterium]|nr:hypothetical protein [Rhodospirillales bacterium]
MTNAVIKEITLEGFRAYLAQRTFDLLRGSTALSLALFADNARGKSSLVDGLEFYLSEKGTVSRLGQVQSTSQGGVAALEHVDARDRSIEPAVSVTFMVDGQRVEGKRKVGGDMPAGAEVIRRLLPVNPIIRGYQLRKFVEDQSEADRYAEVANWFGLQPLVDLQDKLAKLKRDYKKAAEDTRGCELAVNGLSAQTGGAVTRWDEVKVLAWLNATLIAPVKDAIAFTNVSKADAGFLKLVELKQAEDARLGLPMLKALKEALEDIAGQRADGTGADQPRAGGKASVLTKTQARLADSEKAEHETRAASSQALLSPVWTHAVAALGHADCEEERCPVCETPFNETGAGSRAGIVARLQENVAALKAFHDASAERSKAQSAVTTAVNALDNALLVLRTRLESVGRKLPEGLASLSAHSPYTPEQISQIQSECGRAADAVEAEIAEQETARGAGSCKESLERVEKILVMAAAHRRAMTEVNARKDILKAVTKAATELNGQIQTYVSNVLAVLREDVDAIYKRITHFTGRSAPDINLALPTSGKTDRMCLTIDFAPNRKGVAPGGYLSDAQLHSLGLALRLAAIRRFNSGARFVVLDDVVTSYDRDHRQMIANLLAEEFKDFQVIVVTHERQFFEYLLEKLPQSTWLTKRISEVEPDRGPVFDDDRPSDSQIEDLLRVGKSAENEIRKAQEVWLQRVCYEFGVSVTMPKPAELPKFGRAELASALEEFIKDRKMGVDTSFFAQLKMGKAENAGSHGNADASAGPSAGDMSARWDEFKKFRDQFVCACSSKRFKRSFDSHFPRCAKSACETPFKGKAQTNGEGA